MNDEGSKISKQNKTLLAGCSVQVKPVAVLWHRRVISRLVGSLVLISTRGFDFRIYLSSER